MSIDFQHMGHRRSSAATIVRYNLLLVINTIGGGGL